MEDGKEIGIYDGDFGKNTNINWIQDKFGPHIHVSHSPTHMNHSRKALLGHMPRASMKLIRYVFSL